MRGPRGESLRRVRATPMRQECSQQSSLFDGLDCVFACVFLIRHGPVYGFKTMKTNTF
jgi:hypothetical protein